MSTQTQSRPARNTLAIVLAISIPGVCWLAANAQIMPRAAGPEFRIAGRISNSSTGEPLSRATVTALSEQDNHVVASTLSNADGRFVLDHLPAGKYPLTASKRGYRLAFYDEHEDFNSAIVTGDGQDTEHLQFQLSPAAILHGLVTGDGGDPVQGASVMLFSRPDPLRTGERAKSADTTTSDDTGAYEFGNLAAGEYYVAVKAEPWYALHGRASRTADAESTNLDVAYPITYFDSTIDEAAAAPITLAAGTREEANMNLHAVPALHFTVPHSPRRGAPPFEMRQSVFGMEMQTHGADQILSQQGTMEVTGIPPGHYEITQGDPPKTVSVDAASDLEIDGSAGIPSVRVSGTLRNARGAILDEDANLVFEAANDSPSRLPLATFARRGQFQFDAVLPGRWTLSVYVGNRGQMLPITAVSWDARSFAGNQITVGEHPLNVAVTVNRTATRIQGFVRRNGKPAAGSMIVLVPREPSAYESLVRRDQSDSDGSFSLRDVPPGEYSVLAIEDGWKLDWRRHAVIVRYLAGGVAIKVSDGSDPVVRLAQPVEAVPR